jgi:hypothetical protein
MISDPWRQRAFLATTSTFAGGAKSFFDDHLWELEARDFDGVVDWVPYPTTARKGALACVDR